MSWLKKLSLTAAACVLASTVWAMDLSAAMGALSGAKAQGLIGEQADGYLGVVKPQGDAEQIAKLINQARRTEYQRLAEQNNISLRDVEVMAGKKAIDKTPAGQMIKQGAGWQKK